MKNLQVVNWKRYTLLRRIVLVLVLVLFLFQFLRIKLLIGGLSGSLLISWIKLLDPFAFVEALIASKKFTIDSLWAVIPVVLIYLIFGRAFCGWVCPMDLFFNWINRLKISPFLEISYRIPLYIGYIIVLFFLLISFISGIPVFTNYISHLTNFFRTLTALVFLTFNFPVDFSLLLYSLFFLLFLLFLEGLFPRLWCRVLCPVGKIYGLFNKISLLHLKFQDKDCLQCFSCERVCYMGVKIAERVPQGRIRSQACIFCGNCVEACGGKANLIKFKLGV